MAEATLNEQQEQIKKIRQSILRDNTAKQTDKSKPLQLLYPISYGNIKILLDMNLIQNVYVLKRKQNVKNSEIKRSNTKQRK